MAACIFLYGLICVSVSIAATGLFLTLMSLKICRTCTILLVIFIHLLAVSHSLHAQQLDQLGYTPPSDYQLFEKTSPLAISAAALTYYASQKKEAYKLEIFPFRLGWFNVGLVTVFSPDISSQNGGLSTGHLTYALPAGISLPIRTWRNTTLRLDAMAYLGALDQKEKLPSLVEVQIRLDTLLAGLSLGYRKLDAKSVSPNLQRFEGPFFGVTLNIGMPVVKLDRSKPSPLSKRLAQLNAGPPPDLYLVAREDLRNSNLIDATNHFARYVEKDPYSRWSRSARSYLWFLDTLHRQSNSWRDAALSIAQMREIEGAAIIGDSSVPVLFGPVSTTEADSLYPQAIDDFINIVRVINMGNNPGVSIEPEGGIRPNLPYLPSEVVSSTPGPMTVRYLPDSLASTHLGYLLFEADRTLKGLALGRDNLTGGTIHTNVGSYRSVSSLMRGEGASPGYFAAPIFVPKEILARQTTNAVIIDAVTIGLKSQSTKPAAEEFVQIIEQNFAALANENQALAQLARIGRMVAIARWLKSLDRSSTFIAGWSPTSFPSPHSTPTITAEISSIQIGNMVRIAMIAGGVLFSTPTTFSTDPPDAIQRSSLGPLVRALEDQRPHTSPAAWTFEFEGASYQAVQLPGDGAPQ